MSALSGITAFVLLLLLLLCALEVLDEQHGLHQIASCHELLLHHMRLLRILQQRACIALLDDGKARAACVCEEVQEGQVCAGRCGSSIVRAGTAESWSTTHSSHRKEGEEEIRVCAAELGDRVTPVSAPLP